MAGPRPVVDLVDDLAVLVDAAARRFSHPRVLLSVRWDLALRAGTIPADPRASMS